MRHAGVSMRALLWRVEDGSPTRHRATASDPRRRPRRQPRRHRTAIRTAWRAACPLRCRRLFTCSLSPDAARALLESAARRRARRASAWGCRRDCATAPRRPQAASASRTHPRPTCLAGPPWEASLRWRRRPSSVWERRPRRRRRRVGCSAARQPTSGAAAASAASSTVPSLRRMRMRRSRPACSAERPPRRRQGARDAARAGGACAQPVSTARAPPRAPTAAHGSSPPRAAAGSAGTQAAGRRPRCLCCWWDRVSGAALYHVQLSEPTAPLSTRLR